MDNHLLGLEVLVLIQAGKTVMFLPVVDCQSSILMRAAAAIDYLISEDIMTTLGTGLDKLEAVALMESGCCLW